MFAWFPFTVHALQVSAAELIRGEAVDVLSQLGVMSRICGTNTFTMTRDVNEIVVK